MAYHLICERCKQLKRVERHHVGADGLFFVFVARTVTYTDYLRGFKNAAFLCRKCHKYITKVNAEIRTWYFKYNGRTCESYTKLADIQTKVFGIYIEVSVIPKKSEIFAQMCIMELRNA